LIQEGEITGLNKTVVSRKLTESEKHGDEIHSWCRRRKMTKSGIAKQFQIPVNTLSMWFKSANKIKNIYL